LHVYFAEIRHLFGQLVKKHIFDDFDSSMSATCNHIYILDLYLYKVNARKRCVKPCFYVNNRFEAGSITAYIEPGSPWKNGYIGNFNALHKVLGAIVL